MQPTEPSPADVAMVEAAIGGQPAAPPAAPAAPAAPQPQPQPPAQPAPAQPQMQPAPVTPQPAPTSQPLDPFAALMESPTPAAAPPAPQPTAPPTPQPQPPTEPAQPAPTPAEPPVTPPVQGEEEYQSFKDYMDTVGGEVGQPAEQPDPSKIDPNDPAAIKGFFDELINTAVSRANQATQRNQVIQATERRLWDEAFGKYGSLRQNKPLRDMVHSIRMGYFQRNLAITPIQAADKLLNAMKGEYNKGVADSAVVSTIEDVQPQGGGTGTPVPTTLDKDNALLAVQTGGEEALANILDAEIKAGNL